MKELVKIQSELKAPKNQRNNFGKYNYRSCEDILEAVKPLAEREGCVVLLSDEIKVISDRVYVCATASIAKGNESVWCTGWAREPLAQKGMNEAQITGSASSYARKYALNGLFAIDDTKDADATNTNGKKVTNAKPKLEDAQLQDSLLNGNIQELRDLIKKYDCTDLQKKSLTVRAAELKKLK